MPATLSPVTREYNRLHFAACAARLEAAARSDAREYEYLQSSADLPPDFEALDALADSVLSRCDDWGNLLHEVDTREDII